MCRYRLVALDAPAIAVDGGGFPADGALDPEDTATPTEPTGNETPGRKLTSAARLVRSLQVAEYVKRLHAHTCQACGTQLTLGGGRPYAEAAHIRALGRPHDGPDIPGNVLCLCPNCHVLFDSGGLIIDASLQLHVGGQVTGQLRTHPSHDIDAEHLAYHRLIHA
jgi:predicted restriction endonuclease